MMKIKMLRTCYGSNGMGNSREFSKGEVYEVGRGPMACDFVSKGYAEVLEDDRLDPEMAITNEIYLSAPTVARKREQLRSMYTNPNTLMLKGLL